jgi:tRNA G37 N-methylase TrmD
MVPEALLSGDHARIARWREEKAYEITKERRPDLLGATRGSEDSPGSTGKRVRETDQRNESRNDSSNESRKNESRKEVGTSHE